MNSRRQGSSAELQAHAYSTNHGDIILPCTIVEQQVSIRLCPRRVMLKESIKRHNIGRNREKKFSDSGANKPIRRVLSSNHESHSEGCGGRNSEETSILCAAVDKRELNSNMYFFNVQKTQHGLLEFVVKQIPSSFIRFNPIFATENCTFYLFTTVDSDLEPACACFSIGWSFMFKRKDMASRIWSAKTKEVTDADRRLTVAAGPCLAVT
jgi:hypothetical protein